MKHDLRNKLLICLGLAVVTFAVYWQVLGHEFITTFDDDKYVTENPHVQAPFTFNSVRWAFKSVGYSANWHPLTWISHMVDYRLFSLRPMGHHLSNLLLHIACSLLLFLVFSRMTGSIWKSAFVAALFALHPLHVESVAWVAERKDVLSTFFWMLTMLTYAWYVRRPSVARYLVVSLCFALGLLSKPMLVTLPVVLLLMDYWPLRRSGSWGRMIVEKLPLFALAAVSSVMTFIAQRGGEAVATTDVFPVPARIGNALVSYVEYLVKMVWPANLGIYYPHPGTDISVPLVIGSAVLLIAITALVIRYRRRFPYILMGWLWYVITLLPVIGFIQVGGQAMADRYTYVPLIGIFAMLAWGVPELILRRQPEPKPKSKREKVADIPNRAAILALALPAFIVIAALSVVTYAQLRHWKSAEALFAHTLAVTDADRNQRAHLNLAVALATKGKLDEAVRHYRKAIILSPRDYRAHSNFGLTLLQKGRLDEALEEFQAALALEPNSAAVHANLAMALDRKGRTAEGIEEFERSIELDPNLMQAHIQFALMLQRTGDLSGAAQHYERAHKLNPSHTAIAQRMNLLAWLRATSKDERLRNGHEAVRLAELACETVDYQDPSWLDTLSAAYAEAGRFDDAVAASEKALSMPVVSKFPKLARDIAERIKLYKAHKPYHE